MYEDVKSITLTLLGMGSIQATPSPDRQTDTSHISWGSWGNLQKNEDNSGGVSRDGRTKHKLDCGY